MSPWLAGAAGGAAGLLGGKVLRSSAAGMVLAAALVALGAVLVVLEYEDAARSALGEARLEDARLGDLGRRQVRCAHATWRCDLASTRDGGSFVPFECGPGSERISAAFYEDRPDCTKLPTEVAGYLVDMNEAGGGSADWVLRVGVEPRTFPGALSWIGLGLAVLGLAFPRLRAWSANRLAQPRT